MKLYVICLDEHSVPALYELRADAPREVKDMVETCHRAVRAMPSSAIVAIAEAAGKSCEDIFERLDEQLKVARRVAGLIEARGRVCTYVRARQDGTVGPNLVRAIVGPLSDFRVGVYMSPGDSPISSFPLDDGQICVMVRAPRG